MLQLFRYLIELILNGAGLQSEVLKVTLLDILDDSYHLLVVLGSDLASLSEVDVVGDQGFINAVPQQGYNPFSVTKKQMNRDYLELSVQIHCLRDLLLLLHLSGSALLHNTVLTTHSPSKYLGSV